MKKETTSYIYALLAVILWGSVPAISKLTMQGLNFLQLTTYSLFFSIIAMLVIVALQNKITILKQYSKKEYRIMLLLGLVGIFITYLLYFGSINYAMPADAQILNNTWQLFALILAIFWLKERLTIRKSAGLLFGFVGAYIVVTKGSFINFDSKYILGYVLALGSAITEASFVILGKKYHFEIFTSMLIYYISSFLLALLITVVFSDLIVPTPRELIGIICIGAFGIALPYAFIFKAMQLGDTAKVTSITYLSPFLALVFIYLLLGDKLFVAQILGLVLIVAGIITQSKVSRKDSKSHL